MPSESFKKLPAISWALYDFANTIFSAIVVTVYLPLYLTGLSGVHTSLGLSATTSMLLSALCIPLFGALTDRTGRAKSYLIKTTLLCALFTTLLSVTKSVFFLLLLFIFANFLFHCSLVFYNTLLPAVAPPNRQGLISGSGTGLGYLGVAFSLPLAHWIDQNFGRPWVFSAAAILFLAAAIPLFLFVPERRVSFPERLSWTHIKAECYKLGRAVRELPRSRNTFYFLLANLCVLDALNAFILWLSVYITKELLVPQAQFIRIMLALNISAFLFGILMGKVTDVIGSRRTFLISIIALFIAVFVAGTTRNLFLFKLTLLTLGAMAASGIWTAGRKLLIELAPPEEVGKFFGLYGFTTKISAFGSSAFSILADLFNYRAAVLSQLIAVTLGLIFFLQLRSRNRTL